MCCCVLYVCMCQPPAPPMTCGRKSSFAVLAGTQTCTANSSEKAGLSPAHSHPGAQNIGPSGLDRGAAAVRSCPRAARRLSARWLSLVRRRVVSESVLVHTHTSSRRSPASVCCLVCGAKVAEARTRRAAPRWRIDPGRSDLCSERQHARRDRLAAYGAPSPACRSPASTGSAPASAAHDLYINLYNLVYIPEAWLARGSSAPDA